MGDLWALLLYLGFAAPFLLIAGAVLLLIRVAEARWRRSGRAAAAPPPPGRARYPGVAGLFLWGSVATALVLPWGIAVATKLVLDARGLPTHPWSAFLSLEALLVLVPVTLLMWGFPFPALGLFARFSYLKNAPDDTAFKERAFVLVSTYLAGVAAGAFVFQGMFRQFDILYVFVPVGAYIAVPMAGGWLVARSILRLRRRATP